MSRAAGALAVQVSANAKVNLRLRILAREASGYHQLETIFLRLELADTVRVKRARTRSLDVSGDAHTRDLGPVERNLAWRAAQAYDEATGTGGGFAIELEKRIPVGGGLGGGSADAGAVLRALDVMSSAPLGEARLLDIAASLGADVPFLTASHPCALAWGRGERLLALPAPPERDVVLLVPSFGVSTSHAYAWLADSRDSERSPGATLLDPASLTEWGGLAAVATNDFQPVVSARHAEIEAMVASLQRAGCAPAMLSGSGSVVFGVLAPGASYHGDSGTTTHTIRTRTAVRVEPVSVLD